MKLMAPQCTLEANDVRLGGDDAADPVALAPAVDAQLDALADVFRRWTPVDAGSVALKSLLTDLLDRGWPTSVASKKVKAQ